MLKLTLAKGTALCLAKKEYSHAPVTGLPKQHTSKRAINLIKRTHLQLADTSEPNPDIMLRDQLTDKYME